MKLYLDVRYSDHHETYEITPDTDPCGAPIAGHFARVMFRANEAVLSWKDGSIVLQLGEPRAFQVMGVSGRASLASHLHRNKR